jgi:hypothetical protein
MKYLLLILLINQTPPAPLPPSPIDPEWDNCIQKCDEDFDKCLDPGSKDPDNFDKCFRICGDCYAACPIKGE